MGFLFVLMVAVLGSEMRVMGANVVILGLGLLLTGLARDLPALILGTLVTSIGFHYFASGSEAVLLQVTAHAEAPRALGRLSSVGALASVLATLGVFGAALVINNHHILLVGGALVIVTGLALLPRMNLARWHEARGHSTRRSVRRSYWLYYAMTFLMGTRRHIFTTFAVFMLVRLHGLKTEQIAMLFLLNSAINFLALPLFGRWVGRFGERRVLAIDFVCLVGVFMGYATIDAVPALVALFVLDNILFGFNLAINSYFQKIAVIPQDITPNMSLGQSINHVAAVIIPAVGGWMWETFDPATPFLLGAGVAFVSTILTFWMPSAHRQRAWGAAD
jgi:predicted MFS family arabinose efflux permease